MLRLVMVCVSLMRFLILKSQIMKVKSDLIKRANDALISCEIVVNGEYSREFSGYIPSFGASIIQSGLLPTLLFFEDKESDAKERSKVVQAITMVLFKNGNFTNDKKEDVSIAEELLKDSRKEKAILKEVTEAAVALKLALRMYKRKEKDNE